jgi:hypothetical protein
LKNCHNFKTLRIESTRLSVDFIEAIAKFLLKLLKLKLICVRFESDSDICISPIQELKYLEYLELSMSPELTDSSIVTIINSCHNLNYIDVIMSHVSNETLLTFIQFSNKNPNKIFKVYDRSHIEDQIEKMYKTIPKNWIID